MDNELSIMSFDIGIKNMAYCIMNVGESVTIKDWSVIDISKNDENKDENKKETKEICFCRNKNNICCKKIAKYTKDGNFYCEKHAKLTTMYIIPEKRLTKTNLKKLKLVDLHKIVDEFSILGESVVKHNKTEILNLMESFFETKRFEKVCDIKTINAQDIDLITLGRNMRRILDKIVGLDCLTHIILENQISTLASRMKTIQGMLAQYFIMRFDDSITIEFVSSSNKLKGFPKRNDNISNYKDNKSDAIFYTNEILSKNLGLSSTNGCYWSDTLLLKKKDDLSDCFLQGVWYLQKLKCIIFGADFIIRKWS